MKLSVLLAIVSSAQAVNLQDKNKQEVQQKQKASFKDMNEIDVDDEIWEARDLISQAQEDMRSNTDQADSELSNAIELLDEATQTL